MSMITNLDSPGFYVPGNPTYTQLDAENERCGGVGFFATPDGAARTITHICFPVHAATTAGNILAQIESVDTATGLPAGIIAADRSGTEAVAAAGWKETALTTNYALASGTWLGITLTIGTPGNVRIVKGLSAAAGWNFAWFVEDLGGAGAFSKGNGAPCYALKTSTGEYITPLRFALYYSYQNVGISTGTNPRYIGNRITVGEGRRLVGVNLNALDMDYDITFRLVDADGNTIKADDTTTDMSVSVLATYRNGTGRNFESWINFPAPKTLVASTAYYLIASPDSATNTTFNVMIYGSEALMKQDLHIPDTMTLRYITSPSAWSITEADDRFCVILPVFDQIDIGSGGGASPVYGDRTGGLR